MRKKILFSIVTPTYNRVKSGFLKECVESVIEQKRGNFEFEHIIVDDGSTDNTKDYVLSLTKKYKHIKYLNQINSGPAKATQLGISHATGDYTIIIDDDDKLTENSLFIRAEFINNNPTVDWFYGLAEWIDDYGLPINPLFQSKKVEDHFYERLLIINFINGGTPTVKTLELKKVKWPDWINRSQDYFLWLELARPERKLKVAFLDECVVKYRFHSQNYTSNINDPQKKKDKELLNFRIKELHPPDKSFLAKEAYTWIEEAHKSNEYWKTQFDSQIAPLKSKVAKLEEIINSYNLSRIIGPAIRLRDNRRRYQDFARSFPIRAYRKTRKSLLKNNSQKDFVYVRKAKSDKSPLVSIITPYFNRPDTMPETIRSVLDQTFQNFEYIIVDDGSNIYDAKKYIKKIKHPKIKVILQENSGVAAARNNGISKARGRYIMCLDSDDVLDPTYLEKALLVLESDPEASIATFDTKMFGVVQDYYYYGEFNPLAMLEDNLILTAAVFEKKAWEQAGGYKKEIGYEDWEFWVHLTERGFFARHIQEALFQYRTAENSRFIDDQETHKDNTSFIKNTHPDFRKNVSKILRQRKKRRLAFNPEDVFANLSNPIFYKQNNNNKKNILIAIPWMTFGGAETLINNFCKEIYEDYNISFITGIKDQNDWEYKFKEISKEVYHLANLFADERLYKEFIINYIKTRNVDILHIIHTSYVFKHLPDIKKSFPDLKVVVTVFNDRAHFNESLEQYEHIDVFTTDNYRVANKYDKILSSSHDNGKANVIVIPNGINNKDVFSPEMFDRTVERKKLGIKREEISVFFIGRLSEEKNPDVFIKVAEKVIRSDYRRSFRFFMVGDGRLRNEVQKRIMEVDSPRLKYLGYQSQVASFLSSADVFVLPSSVEGFPLSILEAMAMECAIVASDVGAVGEVSENNKQGFVVSPGSVEEIYEALIKLSVNRGLMEKMQRSSKNKVESLYSNKVLGENYKKLYNSLN